jgi:hypothetical protein
MKVARLLAMVAVIGLVSYGLMAADGDTHQKAKAVYGKITKVAEKSVTIKTMVKDGEGKELTIAVDDKTVVTIDKKEAKLADLKADMTCRITPDTASDTVPAATISVWTPKPK